MHSGYWNLQISVPNEVDDMAPLATRYREGWQKYMIPTMRRLFPDSHLAFRNVPYAQYHDRMHKSRIMGVMNALVAEQSRLWGIPVYDQNALALGMYHLYDWDKMHHSRELYLLYLDSVLYRLARMPALP